MGNCASCGGCSGGCPGCGGCDRSLSLTAEEVAFLKRLGEVPFLPVGRKREDMVPIFLEDGRSSRTSIPWCSNAWKRRIWYPWTMTSP